MKSSNVIALKPERSLELDDGAVATVRDGALELCDREGRLLVRYKDGSAEIAAPAGDLLLSAGGRVVVKARSLELAAEKYELVATRIFEKSRDTFREVADLAQTRVGRARTVVASIFTLRTGRTVLASKDETSIDGRKILLG